MNNPDWFEITLTFDDTVRTKFLTGIIIFSCLVIWGVFFISDPGWIYVGITLICFGVLFYQLRIKRIVVVTSDGISEHAWHRKWQWNWREITQISHQCPDTNTPVSAMVEDRIIIENNQGREIMLDSRMPEYPEARIKILQIARTYKIQVVRRKLPVFNLVYW